MSPRGVFVKSDKKLNEERSHKLVSGDIQIIDTVEPHSCAHRPLMMPQFHADSFFFLFLRNNSMLIPDSNLSYSWYW
jgi:hypothetical protein